MDLTVENNRIIKAKNACVLGKAWFLNHNIEDRPDTLARGEADAAMIVASDPMANFSQPARIPYIALDPKETPTVRSATVAFTTSVYGINTGGTVYRMDDVPIPLRPAFESPFPSDFEVLTKLERRVRQLQGVNV